MSGEQRNRRRRPGRHRSLHEIKGGVFRPEPNEVELQIVGSDLEIAFRQLSQLSHASMDSPPAMAVPQIEDHQRWKVLPPICQTRLS